MVEGVDSLDGEKEEHLGDNVRFRTLVVHHFLQNVEQLDQKGCHLLVRLLHVTADKTRVY